MNCFNPYNQCGCNKRPNCGGCCSTGMGSCSTGMGCCSTGMGCGCSTGGCPRPQPIVMPTQVCVNRRVTPQEQPVIVPVERRTINQCCYYPRYYPVYQNTFFTQY